MTRCFFLRVNAALSWTLLKGGVPFLPVNQAVPSTHEHMLTFRDFVPTHGPMASLRRLLLQSLLGVVQAMLDVVQQLLDAIWPRVKSQIVPPVNIPIPTKIGPKMGGAPTPK